MSKLSDVVKNDVVKKTVYDKLVAKVNNIDTSTFVLKTKYWTDKTELEKKIPDASSLTTKTAVTAVENKICNIGSLVEKTDFNTKTSELEKRFTDHNHAKYITIPEFNTLAASVFSARLAQANLITKTDLDAKLSRFNRKITSNKLQLWLVENELKKLKTFDWSYFIA